jgi:hypothetical protein
MFEDSDTKKIAIKILNDESGIILIYRKRYKRSIWGQSEYTVLLLFDFKFTIMDLYLYRRISLLIYVGRALKSRFKRLFNCFSMLTVQGVPPHKKNNRPYILFLKE